MTKVLNLTRSVKKTIEEKNLRMESSSGKVYSGGDTSSSTTGIRLHPLTSYEVYTEKFP